MTRIYNNTFNGYVLNPIMPLLMCITEDKMMGRNLHKHIDSNI